MAARQEQGQGAVGEQQYVQQSELGVLAASRQGWRQAACPPPQPSQRRPALFPNVHTNGVVAGEAVASQSDLHASHVVIHRQGGGEVLQHVLAHRREGRGERQAGERQAAADGLERGRVGGFAAVLARADLRLHQCAGSWQQRGGRQGQ